MRYIATSFAVALLALIAAPAASAAALVDQAPAQETLDGGAGSSSMSGGTWADLPDGVASRPYLKSLTVVNGSDSVPVYTGGPGGRGSATPGDVTAAISAVNLCKSGAPQGSCYARPNRVGISFGYVTAGGGVGRDFAHPSVPLRQAVGPDTTFDVVLGLNSVGSSVRWTWLSGALSSWKTSGLGGPGGEIHLRVKPALAPEVDWSAHPASGCTATPVRDCDLARADGEFLEASMVLSLDETLPAALTGAVFATQHAILGYLQPGGDASDPTLDLQMASSHLRADGSPQLGVLQAFVPAAGLQSLYGVTPEQATTLFGATRIGDPGTSSAPAFTAVGEDPDDSAGLLVTIRDITFSAPTYRLARLGRPAGGSPASTATTPTGGTPPAPAPGAKAPSAKTAAPRVTVRRASRRAVVLAIAGAPRGRATAALLLRGKVVARGSVAVAASGKATLRVALGAATRRALGKARTARVRVTLAGGRTRTISVSLR